MQNAKLWLKFYDCQKLKTAEMRARQGAVLPTGAYINL